MISREEAELIHPGLALLVDLRDADWVFIHRQDDQGVDQIDAFRTWPNNYLDAISVRSATDANGLRTITDEHGIVWSRAGTLDDVVHGLLELPTPGARNAPRLVVARAPRLWTPGGGAA
jgi:hypothetical protein